MERNRSGKKRDQSSIMAAEYGVLIALAFLLSYVETLIPIHLGVPGVKLGLANLVSIVGLYLIGVWGTVCVSLVRIVLVGLTFGNMFAMFYSLAGGALSLLLMVIFKKTNWFSQTGISVIGGVGHNVGQLAVAAFVVNNAQVFYYLPILLAAGTVAGACIGMLAGMVIKRIAPFFKKYRGI